MIIYSKLIAILIILSGSFDRRYLSTTNNHRAPPQKLQMGIPILNHQENNM